MARVGVTKMESYIRGVTPGERRGIPAAKAGVFPALVRIGDNGGVIAVHVEPASRQSSTGLGWLASERIALSVVPSSSR